MKKTIFGLLFTGLGFLCTAQDIKTATKFFDAKQYDKARDAIDAAIAGKEGAKPEAWIWKHKIYWAIGTTDQFKNLVPDALQQGYEALKKGKAMPKGDEAMLKELGLEFNKPFNDYYTNFINTGSAQMNAENFTEAFSSFKSALSVSRFFYDQKFITSDLDTLLTFYAGYNAMKAKKDNDAEYYYKIITDKNIGGTDIQIAYGWLTNYYLNDKKNPALAKATYEKGIKLYPNDEYLKSMNIQIARQSGNPEEIFASYEGVVNSGKAEFSDYLGYGAELYDYLFVDSSVKITNGPAKETRMVEMLNNALKLKPGSAEANYIMGMYYTSKALAGDKQLKTIKGTKPEDVAKKKELQNAVNGHADQSIKFLEMSSSLYGAKSNIKPAEKDHYKTSLQQLGNLYKYKNQADKAKSVAEKLKTLG
jgi:tetratricopeptide (TPR) repeat protein